MKRKFMNQPLARPLTPREKGIRTKYGALFVLAALTALTIAVYYNRAEVEISEQKIEMQKLQHQVDSLHDENFIMSTTIGRYELTMEHLKEVDSLVAQEAQRFLDHETE